MTVQGIIIKGHLGIQHGHSCLGGPGRRIDFQHGRIEITKCPVHRKIFSVWPAPSSPNPIWQASHRARNCCIPTAGSMPDPDNGMRPALQDLLDFQTAPCNTHDHNAFTSAVQHQAKVPFIQHAEQLHIQPANRLAGGAWLVTSFRPNRDSDASQASRVILCSRMPPASGMNPRLDAIPVAVQFTGVVYGLSGTAGQSDQRDIRTEIAQKLFRLTRMNFRDLPSVGCTGTRVGNGHALSNDVLRHPRRSCIDHFPVQGGGTPADPFRLFQGFQYPARALHFSLRG